jgi:hypothetical protein
LCVVYSCSSDPASSSASPSVAVPLQIGNQWIYRITTFDSLGAPLSTVTDTVRNQYDRFTVASGGIRQMTWIEPGRGIIKEEAYRRANRSALQSRAELISRSLN